MSTPLQNEADTILASLPSLTGTGIFAVNAVVPNADGSFNPMDSNKSTSYSYPLMSPAKLIGTITAPFMNVALPSYISTLYNNVFNINKNLQSDISGIAQNDRQYPTSFAVQNYVQSQIAGVQVMQNNGVGNTYIVTTSLNNTLIQKVPPIANNFSYDNEVSGTSDIALLYMDTTPNAPRVGTTKTIVFADPTYLKGNSGLEDNLIFLYAGDNAFFAHMGGLHKYYQFVYTGDFLVFVQAYDPVAKSWTWLVTNCMGVFSDTVSVSSENSFAQAGTVTVPLPESSLIPQPPSGSSFGGLNFIPDN